MSDEECASWAHFTFIVAGLTWMLLLRYSHHSFELHLCSSIYSHLLTYETSMVSYAGICKLLFSSLGAVSCLTPLDSIYLAVSLLYFTALLVFHFQAKSVAHEQTLDDCTVFSDLIKTCISVTVHLLWNAVVCIPVTQAVLDQSVKV